jgi:hypothetical protein
MCGSVRSRFPLHLRRTVLAFCVHAFRSSQCRHLVATRASPKTIQFEISARRQNNGVETVERRLSRRCGQELPRFKSGGYFGQLDNLILASGNRGSPTCSREARLAKRPMKAVPASHAQKLSGMEAGAGIEPANSGFADRDLTTWLPRRCARADNIIVAALVSSADRRSIGIWHKRLYNSPASTLGRFNAPNNPIIMTA